MFFGTQAHNSWHWELLAQVSLHNLTCEILVGEMDLWKADGLKSQQPGDMTALPTSDTSTHSFSTLSWALWIERSPSKADSKLYLILRSKWCKSRNLLGCILRVYRDCNCYKVTAVFLILANFVLALLSWFACRAQVSNTNNCVSYRKKPKQTASFPVNKLYSEKYFLQNSTMVFSSLLENFVTPKNSYQILSLLLLLLYERLLKYQSFRVSTANECQHCYFHAEWIDVLIYTTNLWAWLGLAAPEIKLILLQSVMFQCTLG